MKSVFGAWMDYKRCVMPKQAGATQIAETRQAFYAGVVAVCALFAEGADPQAIEEELGAYIKEFKRMKGIS